jgi:hypothetical protein
VQLVPQEVFTQVALHLPVLLQLAGGGVGHSTVVHPLAVHVLDVQLKVVLHDGNSPQTLQLDLVQFVPQDVLLHLGAHLPVLLQLAGGGGGQAVVLHPLAVQIYWVQVVLRSQKGNSLHRVQLVWVQLVPQELLVQAGVHLPVLLQSAGAGQGTVRQPFLSQVVWVHCEVLVHVG